jgi:hypothetical protein
MHGAAEGAAVVVNDLGSEVTGAGASTRVADEVVDAIRAPRLLLTGRRLGTAVRRPASLSCRGREQSTIVTTKGGYGHVKQASDPKRHPGIHLLGRFRGGRKQADSLQIDMFRKWDVRRGEYER